MKKFLISIVLTVLISFQGFTQVSMATYSINYTSIWSESTHPHPGGNFPPSAHYSKLVGAIHNDAVVFIEMGGIATPGIEDVAELGSNTVFFSEVTSAINAGNANQIIDGDMLNTSVGEINISDIVTTEEYQYLTLISMFAPSPDWVIAANSIDLLDGSGNWRNSITIDMYPYDAGTDSGIDYTSPNMNTDPQEPISSLQGVSPFSNAKAGTLTITLESVVLGVEQFNSSTIQVYPNPTTEIVNISAYSTITTIKIYNVLGAEIQQLNVQDTNAVINLSAFSSGIYLVRIDSEDGSSLIKKLIKL